jgi:hypothetical protein
MSHMNVNVKMTHQMIHWQSCGWLPGNITPNAMPNNQDQAMAHDILEVLNILQ